MVAVIDVETKCDIGQELGVLVDLLYGKCQGQRVLVELGHRAGNRVKQQFQKRILALIQV